MNTVEHFLRLTVFPEIDAGNFDASRDYKTDLQEFLQQDGPVKIEYQVIKEVQTPSSFTVQLVVNGKVVSQGNGHNKKAAEQEAAKVALNELN